MYDLLKTNKNINSIKGSPSEHTITTCTWFGITLILWRDLLVKKDNKLRL
jgi:hypothetical protein